MRTVFALGVLIVIGVAANFLSSFAIRFGGLPGFLIAASLSRAPVVWRFWLGVAVAFLGQAYVGLAFAAWVAAWTRLTAARPDVIGFVVWPVAFVAVAGPLFWNLGAELNEPREERTLYVQREALPFSSIVVTLGFLVFAVFPNIPVVVWRWVPLVSRAAAR